MRIALVVVGARGRTEREARRTRGERGAGLCGVLRQCLLAAHAQRTAVVIGKIGGDDTITEAGEAWLPKAVL